MRLDCDLIVFYIFIFSLISGSRSDIGGGFHLPRGGGGGEGQLVRLSGDRGEVETERPRKDT